MGLIDWNAIKPFGHSAPKPIFITNRITVPIFHLPSELREVVSEYDTDFNNSLDSSSTVGENELAKIMGLDLSKYYIKETVKLMSDNSLQITRKMPNGMEITEKHGDNLSHEILSDKDGNPLVEKLYNDNDSNDRKILYNNMGSGDNKFQVLKIYEYDSKKNYSKDLINFAHDKDAGELTNRCKYIGETYLYNGKEVDSNLVEYDSASNRYIYNNPKTGKKMYFTSRYKY